MFNSMVRAYELKRLDRRLNMRDALVKAHKEFKVIKRTPIGVCPEIEHNFKNSVDNFVKNIHSEGLFTNLNKIKSSYVELASSDMYERRGKHNKSKRPTKKTYKSIVERDFSNYIDNIVSKAQSYS